MKISVNNLTIKYDRHVLFENISFEVQSSQKFCINGPSGCGKSSLLRAMLGFVRPQQGEIRIDNQIIDGTSAWQLRRKIAYVTQEPDLGQHTVLDRIRRPFEYKANAHLQWCQQAVDDLFDRFNLPRKLYHKNTSDLSGGEKQRIAIITALLLDRAVLLLDEPTSALDKQSKQILRDILADLKKTVVFVSHETKLIGVANATYDLTGAGGSPCE